jgi:molybdate transport system substrate-binding protein
LLIIMSGRAHAEQATIAVAANFRPVAEQLVTALTATTPHRYRLVSGSTGKLYAQILAGAPFDVFLAADCQRPEMLQAEGRANPPGVVAYAIGHLALWQPGSQDPSLAGLAADHVQRVALANPRLAPYGAAANATIARSGLQQALADKVVYADNAGLAHALVASGNADAGLLALSTLRRTAIDPREYRVLEDVPDALIEQCAVLLRAGQENRSAAAFLEFLLAPERVQLLQEWGYSRANTPKGQQ